MAPENPLRPEEAQLRSKRYFGDVPFVEFVISEVSDSSKILQGMLLIPLHSLLPKFSHEYICK